MASEVEMQMIFMICIGLWSQHGGKPAAGRPMRLTQKPPLCRARRGPSLFDRNRPAVFKGKGQDIERIGKAVF